MSTLPDDPADDIALSVLQRLAHDGTSDEVAQNFKEQGNEHFRGTQGVEVKADDGQLRDAMLLNHVACNLELYAASLPFPLPPLRFLYILCLLGCLENYVSVLRDCATIIAANTRAPSNTYYRAGLALLALDRLEEVLDVSDERHALFLYPEYTTSDVISDFVEDTSFAAILAVMIPLGAPRPQWDVNGKYADGSLVVYVTMERKRLLKVGREMTLRAMYRAAGSGGGSVVGPDGKDWLEVRDECLSFVVLLKGEAEQKWVMIIVCENEIHRQYVTVVA
ncbi:hypothetical protein BJV78DRAFT_1281170 [Lactifluus subvellereus]|nr:hypothetical protein BJV78DRAFT_1281170 [Lactifluus subvellereus]